MKQEVFGVLGLPTPSSNYKFLFKGVPPPARSKPHLKKTKLYTPIKMSIEANAGKNPLVAALLNLFLFGGVGYLYMGQKSKGIYSFFTR